MWKFFKNIFKKKNLVFRYALNSYVITVPSDAQSLIKITEFLYRAGVDFVYDKNAPPTSYQIAKLPKDAEQYFFNQLNEFCRQNKFELKN